MRKRGPKTDACGLFLIKRGISVFKLFKTKVRKGKKLGSAKSEHERASTSPKTCGRGPFLIKRGISEKTDKNKS
jgi:hypothetical protein